LDHVAFLAGLVADEVAREKSCVGSCRSNPLGQEFPFERKDNPPQDFPNYAAGSSGPAAADELLAGDGRAWRLLD
jgi:hypothetical protein